MKFISVFLCILYKNLPAAIKSVIIFTADYVTNYGKEVAFMTLEEMINHNHSKLNENDKLALSYIMKNKSECQGLSISELSKRCMISTASIIRLTQKLGLSGYSELKYVLRSQLALPESISLNTFDLLTQDIDATVKLMKSVNFTPFVKLIDKADRIFAYGTGYSQRNLLKDFSARMVSCSKNIFLIPARHELDNQIPYLKEGDLIIIASYSGEIADYSKSIHALNLLNIPIISVTSFSKNDLATFTPYNLYYQATALTPGETIQRVSYLTLNLALETLYRRYLEYIRNRSVD